MLTPAAAIAGKLIQSVVDSRTRVSLVDVWIGSRVRIKRTSLGMSRQQLSKRLGIDEHDLATFEAGAERIRAHPLFRIAESLDVRPDYLFRGYVEESPEAM